MGPFRANERSELRIIGEVNSRHVRLFQQPRPISRTRVQTILEHLEFATVRKTNKNNLPASGSEFLDRLHGIGKARIDRLVHSLKERFARHIRRRRGRREEWQPNLLNTALREQIEADGQALIHLDLAPGYSLERLVERLTRPQGARSLASHLERTVNLRGVKAGLLWEFVPKEARRNPARLAAAIKDLAVPLLRPRPIEEAISSAGGVPFEALDKRLMLKALPGVFCAGEMLDWEAPTGGYLLTGCLATGKAAAAGVLDYIAEDDQF